MSKTSTLDRRSRYSLQVIRQALFELLEVKKLDEITVVDLCMKADVNRGTFYKYYRDVPDLYDKTENSLVDEIYALIKKPEYDVYEERFFFREVLEILAENKEFTYIARNKEFSERLAQKLLKFFVPYLKQMLIVKCPEVTEASSELLLEYVLGGCIRVVSYWLKQGMQIAVSDIEKELSAMINCSLSMYR